MLKQILDYVLSPAVYLPAVGALLGLLGKWLLKVNRRRQLALVAYYAFHIVEDLDAELGTETLDKWVEGLKAANEYCLANGWRPVKPAEEKLLDLHFTALNGQTKVAAKVAEDAPLAKG